MIEEGESIRQTAKELGISTTFITDWILAEPEFAARYAKAKEVQAERFADEIVAIADAATPEYANVARLQVDARKWVSAKLLPKKYGDKPQETHVTTNITNVIPVERQKQLQERMKAATQRS